MTLRFLIILACLLASGAAFAHDARPLSIEIEELDASRYSLAWRAPGSVEARNAPEIKLEPPCKPVIASRGDDPLSSRAIYSCEGGLEGAALSIRWPYYNPSLAALVRLSWRSGEIKTAVLDPATTQWRAPAKETFAGVSKSYFTLGVEHILGGIDHVLFLAGLLILARTPKRVLVTATGFTLAHSVTLALVALDLIRVSIPAIEAMIALSIVFVAAEIARGDKTTIAWRRPVVVASAFGLLHGAGFAAALGEIGLPQTEKIPALFFFNVGVEAGQVMLIAAAFSVLFLARRVFTVSPFPEELGAARLKLAGYGLGAISSWWFVERALAALA